MTQSPSPRELPPIEPPPVQLDAPQLPFLVEVDRFVRASEAREMFKVSGKGLCAAVLDTGVNTGHVDFAGRILAGRNFTSDNGGAADDVTDGNGHGTNVAGIVLAQGDHTGMAPEAGLAALKVLKNTGTNSFLSVEQALDWVLAHHADLGISAVCMSLSDGQNHAHDEIFAGDPLADRIAALWQARVAVGIAAGNHYFTHHSQQGMGFPAILSHAIAVGAVYDDDVGGFVYVDGAEAFETRPGQFTPFSQRLHESFNPMTHTAIFAPGAPVRSSGIRGPHGESRQSGTSQATPVVVGVILLLQELYLRHAGELPTVEQLVGWLRGSGVPIIDRDEGRDNVRHTELTFLCLDAVRALGAVQRDLQASGLVVP